MSDYSVKHLLDDVDKSDIDTILSDTALFESAERNTFHERANMVSLYPSWLIDDDIFGVMEWTFASSLFVDHLQNEKFTKSKSMDIRTRIIPQSIVSLYDNDKLWESDGIGFIEEFINKSGVKSCGLQMVPVCRQLSVEEKGNLIQSVYDNIVWQSTSENQDDIVILIDRRKCTKGDANGHEKLWIFQCTDQDALDPLDRNYLFGFDFEIGNVVRSWCRFGEYQRIRFFPEYLTSLIPRLFVTPEMSPMEYLMKIYDSDFKHQWRVSLDDPTFNLYYKAITGDDHISNNYHRERVAVESQAERTLGLWEYLRRRTNKTDFHFLHRWHIEHDMDSDAVFDDLVETDETGKPLYIRNDDDSNFGQWTRREQIDGEAAFLSLKRAVMKWKKMECDGHKGKILDLKDCRHINVIVRCLKAFQSSGYEVDASNLAQFNLVEIIQSLDHMVADHHLMGTEHRAEIHRFISTQLTCDEMEKCPVLTKYRNRVRERTDNARDGVKRIRADGYPLIIKPDPIERECGVMNDALTAVHALLLHRDFNQCRESYNRFGSGFEMKEMEEKKEDQETNDVKGIARPMGINFGVSVIRWIPFGELPYFQSLRDEIVNNKDSTIDEEMFERYLIECIVKIKGTTFSLREMLALKLYTDTTVFQSILRKAHWTTSSLSMRKMYYFWASALYGAALYHSVPISSVNGKSPQTLYHGLNRIFTVNEEHPKYHGPFSSSTLKTVAHHFSDETGLYFRIMPSYSNPLQCSLGIDVQTISCFKDEREILLVDQYIPIRSAKTFQNDPSLLVDLLMFTVKGRTTEIRDRSVFFRKLGIQFDSEWIELIKGHSELFEISAFGGRLVIARLYMELDIWSDDWVPSKVNKENADKDLLIYCVEKKNDSRLLPWYQVLKSRFVVSQSHFLKRCWEVDFESITKEQRLLNPDIMETEYRINGSQIEYGISWIRKWPKHKLIHRIECRNRNLFGEQVVWTQEFDKSMDADPKKFVVPVERNKEVQEDLNHFAGFTFERPRKTKPADHR